MKTIVQPVMPSQIYSDAELCQWFEWAARHQSDPYWHDKIMEVRIVSTLTTLHPKG